MSANMMMPRSVTQKAFKVAGYHDSIRDFARLLEVSGLPKHVADNAWNEGKRERDNGLPCSCWSCQRVN
jgi:hypothetical protein